ncbi:MAG: VOC family protein [Chloroflexota bacterium]
MIKILDLNHVTIVSKDVDASRRFYLGVLGMEELDTPKVFTHLSVWFHKGNAEIHLVHEPDSTQRPGDPPTNTEGERDWSKSRHFALAVEDIDEAKRTLEEHNIPIVLGPRPRGDGPMQMFCYDPDGHLIELHTLKQ